MLNDASGFKKVYLTTGYTDLRRGMEGLATIIRFRFRLEPYDKNTLFLFCGKRSRIYHLHNAKSVELAKKYLFVLY